VSTKVLPLLAKHGLAFSAMPLLRDDGKQVLRYALLHVSGEERGGDFLLPDKATAQQMGSAITYARRYTLQPVTGVAPGGQDDDGAAASQAKPAPRQQRPQRPPSRPTADPVRTATTGADHERLRHGTVEPTPDDHLAQRTKGPIPDGENQWQGPPPAANGGGRIGLIVQHFNRLGVTDRGVRLGYTAALTGHAVNSTSELDASEQKELLDKLAKCKNQAALDSLSKQEAST